MITWSPTTCIYEGLSAAVWLLTEVHKTSWLTFSFDSFISRLETHNLEALLYWPWRQHLGLTRRAINPSLAFFILTSETVYRDVRLSQHMGFSVRERASDARQYHQVGSSVMVPKGTTFSKATPCACGRIQYLTILCQV